MSGIEDETRQLVAGVATSLAGLTAVVDEFAGHQAVQLRRTRRALRWTIGGLIVDLLLTIGGAGLYVQVHRNSEHLHAVDDRVNTQALCPLYELFLRAYNPNSPVAQADPAEYDRDFIVIEAGARALGCIQVVRGR